MKNIKIMDIVELYQSRIAAFSAKRVKAHRLANRLSLLRLLLILLVPIVVIAIYPWSPTLAMLTGLVLIAAFALAVKLHLKAQLEERYYGHQLKQNETELEVLNGNVKGLWGGAEFEVSNHRYASDLDIVGDNSLYALVNRAVTWSGRKVMADWLLGQADVAEVTKRQEAVKELKEMIDFRQSLHAHIVYSPNLTNCPSGLYDWISEPASIAKPNRTSVALAVLSLISLAGIIAAAFGYGYSILSLSVLLNFVYNIRWIKRVGVVHQKLSRNGEILNAYSRMIDLVRCYGFQTALLKEKVDRLHRGKYSASHSVKRLSVILKRFDLRLNMIIGVPLNLLFFWDVWQLMALDRWKHMHRNDVQEWFSALGELECLSSMANLSFNNPGWAFPSVGHEDFILKAEGMGHPLIRPDKRVGNDVQLDGPGKLMLVTGSNMSGKSTFLRTLGVNMVLAGAGSPVCATRCELSIRTPYTSMRIADSLEGNISTFYAELKRISEIILAVNANEKVMLLLDEILRGTNSVDRHKGALALIRQLISSDAVGVIATHDLGLALPELINNRKLDPFYFDVQVEDENLFFDYKLHAGTCKTLNASILMRKMGVDVEVYGDS